MANDWYYKLGNEVVGPIDNQGLKNAARDGDVGPDTLVRLSKEGKWLSAAQVSGLFATACTEPPSATRTLAPRLPPSRVANEEFTKAHGFRLSTWHFVSLGAALLAATLFVVVALFIQGAKHVEAQASAKNPQRESPRSPTADELPVDKAVDVSTSPPPNPVSQSLIATPSRWLNESYFLTVTRIGEKKWQDIDKSGRVVLEYNETARTNDYVELFCPERNYSIRLFPKRQELQKQKDGPWAWSANGHWEPAAENPAPEIATPSRWLNESYFLTVTRIGEKKWQDIDKSGRVVLEYNETARTNDYVELFCPERNYSIRLFPKRQELQKQKDGPWAWSANGHWEPAAENSAPEIATPASSPAKNVLVKSDSESASANDTPQVPSKDVMGDTTPVATANDAPVSSPDPLSSPNANKDESRSKLDISHPWRGKGKLLASLIGKRAKFVAWDFRGDNPIVEFSRGKRVTLPFVDLSVPAQQLARELKKEAQDRGIIPSDEQAKADIELEDKINAHNAEILVEIQRWLARQSVSQRAKYQRLTTAIVSVARLYLADPKQIGADTVNKISQNGAEEVFLSTDIGNFLVLQNGKPVRVEDAWKAALIPR